MPRINFRTSDRIVEFPDGDDVNVLRVSIREECGLPWRCASGNCGTDRILVEEGAEHLSAVRRRERERLGDLLQQGYRLACQTYTSGDITITWDPDQRGLEEDSAAGERLRAKWLGAADTA
ncbi:MAG TPA: 2Fe-2S iron-sulfur cluster binding domain-containing protein [Ilumatobacteraceae bacterium]|nr:2Fe-2S iron-sulfur cluster binding domain-containing protein [Ilumatobacteraceae bacterium]